MNNEKMINMALTYAGISQRTLAEQMGVAVSNLNQKIKRNSLRKEDMEQIAAAIGAKFICYFEFPDGTKI